MTNDKLLSELIAHSKNSEGQTQSLESHLRGVAERARAAAEKFGFEEAPALADWLGWWHDAGKIADDVQTYLRNPKGKAQGPDHSSVGALFAAFSGNRLEYCVAGHHSGLPDANKLKQRLIRKEQENRIRQTLGKALDLLPAVTPTLPSLLTDPCRCAFFLRMLHSALVDADSLDTECHFNPARTKFRERFVSVETLWKLLRDAIERKPRDTDVNRFRHEIFQQCVDASTLPQGFFNLTVPTGGGKTLSGMAFALKHALTHGLQRVIVAIPYTSIIEQNADEYRNVFGADAVLEHHSAVNVSEKRTTDDQEDDAERWERIGADNWDVPIVVTTTVQFFESLFAHRNSRIRKLHNIACSVIVLDEAQTLPIHLLEPTLEALKYLVEDYGCTVVFSTATQPALNARDGFRGIPNPHEIIQGHANYFQKIKRVLYHFPKSDDELTPESLAERVSPYPQALVVLNTIRDSLAILDHLELSDVFYLSSNLCGDHRRDVLHNVRHRLRTNVPCLLVSTQVVEAGVNLDFPVAFRAMGPLDRIAQVAGRCNREGLLEMGNVHIVRFGRVPPGAYKTGTGVADTMLRKNPNLDLNDPHVFRRYFEALYGSKDLDEKGIGAALNGFNFETVGKNYRLMDDDTVAVVMLNYQPEAVEPILTELRHVGHPRRDLMRRLQPHLVNVRRRTFDAMRGPKLKTMGETEIHVWLGKYDALRGFVSESSSPGDFFF